MDCTGGDADTMDEGWSLFSVCVNLSANAKSIILDADEFVFCFDNIMFWKEADRQIELGAHFPR